MDLYSISTTILQSVVYKHRENLTSFVEEIKGKGKVAPVLLFKLSTTP
jgi:hypothetical protein